MKKIYLLFLILNFGCSTNYDLDFNKKGKVKYYIPQTNNTSNSNDIFFDAKIASFKYNTSKCNFVLVDINRNGIYNEKGIDAFEIIPYNQLTYSFNHGINIAQDLSSLRLDTFSIKLKDIDPKGNHANIEIDTIISNISSSKSLISILPVFEITTLKGETLNTHNLLGKKYLYIEFWGTWCSACVKKIPEIKKIHTKYNQELKIISLAPRDNIKDVTTFINEKNIHWSNALVDKPLTKKFNQMGFPSGYLFDKNGILLQDKFHPSDFEKYLSK